MRTCYSIIEEKNSLTDFKIAEGDRVRVVGLQNQTDLNGKAATAKTQLDDGRWKIEMDDKSVKSIKKDNLRHG